MRTLFVSLLCLSVGAVTALSDIIATKAGSRTGEVVLVEANGITIKDAKGEFKILKTEIIRLDITKPPGYDAALAALKAGKGPDAVTTLKPIVDRLAGATVPWVQDALLRLGDAYLMVKDFPNAKRTFDTFKRIYADSPLAASVDVKFAHVLIEQADSAKAAELLKAFLAPMIKKSFLTDDEEMAVAEALVLLGDCQLAANAPTDALESYLKVVTLFDLDQDRAGEAKHKAGKVFEQLKNWKRAKESFADVVKDFGSSRFAADAQQRLAKLKAEHPE